MIGIQIEKMFLIQKELLSRNKPVKLNLRSLTYELITKKRYKKIFLSSVIIYSIIFSIISGTVIYQSSINFSEAFNVSIPSIKVIYCCGSIGQYPNAAIYLTEHIGAMLIPISIVLLITISTLVAWNVMFIAFALNNRPKNNGKWLLSIGAITGLFTGCPTCAGFLLTSVVPGSFVISTTIGSFILFTLSNIYYQMIFLVITLLLLMVSPSIMMGNIKELYEKGCIIENTTIKE